MTNPLSVNIGTLKLQNPIMPASGTFDTGLESVIDFNRLGAFVTKTFTEGNRSGNPMPRICEVNSGMLNAIGIPSKGVEHYINETVPFYNKYQPPLIASISANTVSDFARLGEMLTEIKGIAAIEANISCPNIEENGKAFAVAADSTAKVVKALREAITLPLWVKLTPNTSDIISVAKAAEANGSDAIVVGNTLLGMSIDIRTAKPRLGNIMGGFSGPAIKPVNLRMTYQCFKNVNIPIIGCGGISTAEDVIEYFYAGASAAQVGTASFIHSTAMIDILNNLTAYCEENKIVKLSDLTGSVIDDQFKPYTAMS